MPPKERNSLRRRLRQLAWALALVLALLAWWVDASPVSLPMRLAAASVFAMGTLWPNLFYGPYLVFVYPPVWLLGRLLRRPGPTESIQSVTLPPPAVTLRRVGPPEPASHR
jgi:hypothetical protein